MRVTCRYTGLVFTYEGFETAKSLQSHPVCQMQVHALNKLAAQQLSSSEEKLLLVALLSKIETIEWDIPCQFHKITPAQVASYLPRAHRLANWSHRLEDEELERLPYYRVSAETSDLGNLGAYLVALEGFQTVGRYLPDNGESSKTPWETSEKVQAARRAMLMRSAASKEAVDSTIPWAIQCLSLHWENFTVSTAKMVRDTLTGKHKNMPSVMKEVREMLLIALPETDIQDDIRKTALISRVDELLLKQLNFLQDLGLDISEEQQLLDDIQATYTLAGTEHLSSDGKGVLNSAASPVKFLRQIQSAPLTGNSAGMFNALGDSSELPPVATTEPRKEDFANGLLFAVAHKRWRESQTK